MLCLRSLSRIPPPVGCCLWSWLFTRFEWISPTLPLLQGALSVPVANLGMQVAIKWKRILLLETSLPSNFDQIEALARDGLSTMKFWNDISVESSRMNSLYWRWPYWSFPSVTSLLAKITGSGESDWPSVLGNMGNHSALQLSPRLNLLIYVLSY